MVDARDPIPRTILSTDQQRRIGAMQAAKTVLYGSGYSSVHGVVDDLLRVAEWIATGHDNG